MSSLMRASRNSSGPLRLHPVLDVGRPARDTTAVLRRPWVAVGLALALFVALVLVLAPLLSFIAAVAFGAGLYALFGQRGRARLGRMRMRDLYGNRPRPPTATLLFLDLSALALLGGGLVFLASLNALSADTLIALGLGAVLVIVARAA